MPSVKSEADHHLKLEPLPTPEALHQELPRTQKESSFILESRETIRNILAGKDPRLLVVMGPCSIHDIEAGRDYAERLKNLPQEYQEKMVIVMRAYFQKPRTSAGWKGLIMDPHLDGSCDISEGLRLARSFLKELIALEIPSATEMLDVITPEYIGDLVSWGAIGARTIESQTHRHMASGLPMPLGFKNSTAGSILAAIHAMQTAQNAHTFLGINTQGQASVITTTGNRDTHIILRGGKHGPNYSKSAILQTERMLAEYQMEPKIMVDCSHDNSSKDPQNQCFVLQDVLHQIESGNTSIMGIMLESNLKSGSQVISGSKEGLKYGLSITDGCIGWEETENLLAKIYSSLKIKKQAGACLPA